MPDLMIRTMIRRMDDNQLLRHRILDEKKKIVIYTNGMGGKLARKYLLHEFGICPEYTIDNKLYNGEDVLNIEQAKKRDNRNSCFLICSYNNDFYDEVRDPIYKAFPEEQIIDLFPREKLLPSEEEICKMLHYVDTYIDSKENADCL